MEKILMIEDDLTYAKILKDMLNDAGYDVEHTAESVKAIDLAKNNDYDLIICDYYLNDLTGSQIVEIIKMYKPNTKILILSNSSQSEDELISLRVGVEDFIKKNSTFEIILARIRNSFEKKPSENNTKVIRCDIEGIIIDVENKLVKKNGELVHLTHLELDLLVYMLKNKNKLLSREQLIEDVWKVPADFVSVDLRTIDAHIKNLRNKLALSSIFSVRGVGYRWYE